MNLLTPGQLWKGIVALERPDPMKPSDGMVLVTSARRHAGGMRAVHTKLPLSLVADRFRAGEQFCVCYAELTGDPTNAHLQIHDRAHWREFFSVPEQLTAAH
jgi:hypothetical protein